MQKEAVAKLGRMHFLQTRGRDPVSYRVPYFGGLMVDFALHAKSG